MSKVKTLNNPNSANYSSTARWNGQDGNVTTVGSNGGPSYYGTYDQSGNNYEWNDMDGSYGASRAVRGGYWKNITPGRLSSDFRFIFDAAREVRLIGFRVASRLNPFSLPGMVLVGDAGNAADSDGYGSVAEEYRIGRYEVTNDEYTAFLNAVASVDTYSLYSDGMSGTRGGIIRSGVSGSYSYSVKPNYGNKPVNWVSWFDCARYCNWLHNGSLGAGSTEDGSYTLVGAVDAVSKNASAKYHIPTENEWHKAAYYTPNKNGTGPGYWLYATQSDSAPTPVTADSSGNGIIPASVVSPKVKLINNTFKVKTSGPPADTFWLTGSDGTVSLNVTFTGTGQVNWGGLTEALSSGVPKSISTISAPVAINFTFQSEDSTVTSISTNNAPSLVGGRINIKRFANLQTFTVANQNITDLLSIPDCLELVTLAYNNNQITGSIPSLSNNTKLRTFQCQSNLLTGSIPNLDNNIDLRRFYCHLNNLTGSVPSLNNNTLLTQFNCGQNNLSGSLPNLSNNVELSYFICTINDLTGSIPSLSSNIKLEDFQCDRNQLSGNLPNLDNNPLLNSFVCFTNNLVGPIPSLDNNVNLVLFQCSYNLLTGNIPSLNNNIKLREFYCSTNALSGTIPSLSNNTNLERFTCDINSLTGPIPSLSNNNKLILFYCNNNQLTGTIPSFANNPELSHFFCSQNQLTGSIPNFDNNSKLFDFRCSNNQLTGFAGSSVPITLGSFLAHNNLLSSSSVDAILAALVAAGRTNVNGICNLRLDGSGNAPPSSVGLTNKNTLISRGWTVSTN
jgi:formylglycine-generating enzyme required for sulfatase activity/Leucine-rich repeat (LRR) protein